VTSNLTINNELEVELDKKITSLGAVALPQHRLRSSVTLDWISSTARLLTCRISASLTIHVSSCSNLAFGRSQDSLPTPTSFSLAVSRRRSPCRHAFASHVDFFVETSSFKCSSQMRHQLHSVPMSYLFYRRSFATVTSLLTARNSMETLPDVQHPTAATRLHSKFCRHFSIFSINLFDIELDDRRRA
jgi:hypothetical protein